jgi:hypothetical protein
MGTAAHLEHELRQALLATPFVPFTRVLKDGRKYQVKRKFACAYAGDRMCFQTPDGSVRAGLHDIASLLRPAVRTVSRVIVRAPEMSQELNFEDELSRLRNAKPFVPFTVMMASGDRYEVDNPDLIAFGNDVVFIARSREKGGSAYCRIYNVSSIEVGEPV